MGKIVHLKLTRQFRLYSTREGSGMGHSEVDLRRLCPDSTILRGTPIHGADVATADREVNQIVNLVKE